LGGSFVRSAIIVGAGVVGLTTAYRLLQAGWQVRVISAAPIEGSTSYLAAAVWFPTHVGPPERVVSWGQRTYDVLQAQALAGDVPGVLMRETLVLGREPMGRPDWVDAVGDVRPASVTELPPGYHYGLRFTVPLVEMPLYLPWLQQQIQDMGGVFTTRHITSLTELMDHDPDAVVNCSGLAARSLVGDASVYPVRGQIVRVANPGLTLSVRDEHHPDGRAYVHPRGADCILGGTLEENNWDTKVDLSAAASILRRCLDIVPQLVNPTVLEHIVGLRPGRPAVRLEEDTTGRGPRIVHNYGHGGSGITLSWGCAEDVVALLNRGAQVRHR